MVCTLPALVPSDQYAFWSCGECANSDVPKGYGARHVQDQANQERNDMHGKHRLVGWLRAIAGVLVGAAAIVSGCTDRDNDNPIKVGVVMELTGASSDHGKDGVAAIEMALEKVNAEGGIKGRRIEIALEDIASKPAKMAEAMNKVINVDHVVCVIGPITTAATMAGAEIAGRNKVVLFSPTAAAPQVHGASPYCFRIGLMTDPQGQRMADYCFKERGIREMGMLVMNDETGVAYADSFEQAYKKLGGRIHARMDYQKTDTEMRVQLTNLKQQGIRHLYVTAVPRTMGFIVRQARELDYKPEFFANAGVEGQDFVTIGGVAAEGVTFTGLAPTEEFVKAFEMRTKRQPSIAAPQSYDAFNIIVNALKAKGDDPEGVRQYLVNMPAFQGVGGVIRFDNAGEVERVAHLKTVEAGRFVRLTQEK
jgi:branched-chain amino acid transport system substrate-binding protein